MDKECRRYTTRMRACGVERARMTRWQSVSHTSNAANLQTQTLAMPNPSANRLLQQESTLERLWSFSAMCVKSKGVRVVFTASSISLSPMTKTTTTRTTTTTKMRQVQVE